MKVEDAIPKEVKLSVYRIVQEQLNNILKYAKAQRASVHLRIHDDSLKLVIEDDGVGYSIQQSGKGMGLKNIESRVLAFGGEMAVETAPGKGFTLVIRYPLSASDLPPAALSSEPRGRAT